MKPSSRPKERWPEYALGAWEDSVYKFKALDAMLHEIQEKIVMRHFYEAIMLASDGRVICAEGRSHLHQARSGNYAETEERA